MSDQSEVLKEFLIKIGYQLDQSSERKALDSIASLTKGLAALGVAAAGVALAVGNGVQRMAVQFDQMYFASQRIGTSASNLRAYSYALSQLGVDANEASQAMEGLGRRIRENPGTAKQLESVMGVKVVNGKLSDQNILDIGAFFRKKIEQGQGHLAIAYGEDLGIGERAMTGWANRQFGKLFAQSKEKDRAAGFDPDKAARDAQRFMQAWRDVFRSLEVIVDNALSKIMGGEGKGGLETFAKWFETKIPLISATVAELATAFGGMVSQFVDEFTKDGAAEKAMKNFADGARDVARAFRDIGASAKAIAEHVKSFERLMDWIALDSKLYQEKYGLSKQAAAGKWVDASRPAIDADIAGQQAAQAAAEKGATWGGAGRWWRRTMPGWLGGNRGRAMLGDLSSRGRVARGALANNQKEAYAAARAEGLSDAAARAFVANVSGESLDNPHRRNWDFKQWAHGMVQWDPVRAARIEREFGKMPHHMSIAEQTKAALWEMKTRPEYRATWNALNGGGSAESMVATLVSNYERPRDEATAIRQRIGFLRGLKVDGSGSASAPVRPLPRRSPEEAARVQAQVDAAARTVTTINKSPFGALRMDAFKVAPIGTGSRYMSGGVTNHNSSTVSVKVDGAQEPDAVARFVARRVRDENSRAMRDGRGAVN